MQGQLYVFWQYRQHDLLVTAFTMKIGRLAPLEAVCVVPYRSWRDPTHSWTVAPCPHHVLFVLERIIPTDPTSSIILVVPV